METNGSGQQGPEETTKVGGRLVGMVRAQRAEVRQSMTGVVAARGPVSVKQGMAGAMFGTGDTNITQGYAMCVGTVGEAHIHQGGTQWLFTARGVEFDQGGALVVAAPKVSLRRGFLGLALAQHVELDESSKQVFTPATAAIFGAAFGAAVALLSIFGLLRRKRD
jgi:hypothetical protein